LRRQETLNDQNKLVNLLIGWNSWQEFLALTRKSQMALALGAGLEEHLFVPTPKN
jgi:hypothetical protein